VENQRVVRAANRRLQDVAGRTVQDGAIIPFLCECAADSCMGRIEITLDDYFLAHLDPDHYVLLRGHPRVDGEDVIGHQGRYELVSKAAR
jgi:hypothetical protein